MEFWLATPMRSRAWSSSRIHNALTADTSKNSTDLITAALEAGQLAVEYRMRCFLGPESVRADNALALAAEVGRFDDCAERVFAAQPPEGTGGFTTEDLLRLGARAALHYSDFVSGVRDA